MKKIGAYGYILFLPVMVLGLLPGLVTAQQDQGQAVSALGRLEPEGGIVRLGAPSTPEAISGSVLKQLLVAEGDRVSQGQLLAVTDTATVVEAIVSKTEAELEQAVRAAEAAHSRADEACVLARVAASEAERRANLLNRKLASQEETELAEGQAQAGEASCVAAQATARVADSSIKVARANLAFRQAEFERTRIYAPFDGVVLDLTVKPGELIKLDGVMELGRVDRMLAIAEVYETDIRWVRTGQRATVTSDALAEPLTGRVQFIAQKVHKQDEIGTDPAARKDARIIEVEILLDDPSRAASLTNLQVEVVIQP